MVVSLSLQFVPDWNPPSSCDQHNQVQAKRVALLASVRRLGGEFFLQKLRGWMTVYLWAFLSSRLPVLHHQALSILCLQGDRHYCTYKAFMLPISAVYFKGH